MLKTIVRTVDNDAASKVAALNVGARITRAQPNPPTADELGWLLAMTPERWPQHDALVLVLVTTTMCIATALALRWEDLDLETQELVWCGGGSRGRAGGRRSSPG